MSKSANKMTFDILEGIVQKCDDSKVVVDEKSGMSLSVKRFLDFDDAMSFVRSVADSCFDSNDGYMPEVFEFAIAINVMMYYADVSIPTDYAKAYRVIAHSDIYHMVLSAIEASQLTALIHAARERVEYLRDFNIQTNASKMRELIDAMDRVVSDSAEAARMLDQDSVKHAISVLMGEIRTDNVAGEAGVNTPDNIVPLPMKE